MRIIIEDYPYEEKELKQVIPSRLLNLPNKKGQIRPPYVGYCFNSEINDCIFFLPKVVLTKDKNDEKDITGRDLVFDQYNPKDLLYIEKTKEINRVDKIFLQKFSIWIYRALNIFYKNTDSSVVSKHSFSEVDTSSKTKDGTLIDTFLSLIRFARENKDYVMFEIKNIHSGYNRVNWKKTISHQVPIRQKKSPLYLNPINKKKQIDFDEELFVIYFSILEYIHNQYGFNVEINYNYETIKGSQFTHYLNGYGKIRLRQIKYKYFNDKALKLWSLCYTFFENSDLLHSSKGVEDFLIAKDFENVFEKMVEHLLGEEVRKGFKDQNDGKIVDHLYPYTSLINTEKNIYHIADSKYYKVGSKIGKESIYKQFTYAKNIIQLTLDIFFKNITETEKFKEGYLQYRDKLTEGYNITPNFFISAKIEKEDKQERYSFSDDNLEQRVDENGEPVYNRLIQFENRIFDRDTLFLSHYDINFLYLIALYGKNNHYEQSSFKKKARNLFRDMVIKLLDLHYEFYLVDPSPLSLEDFVNENFKQLNGKLFHFNGKLIMGLEKKHTDTERLKNKYSSIISPFILS